MHRGIWSRGIHSPRPSSWPPRSASTIPRRVYTQAHMDVVAEPVNSVYDQRA
ncbi:MAG: hypothetical protein U0470_13530 [Anaerolineae bacterium]